jgi:hydroxymethylbilane synthase
MGVDATRIRIATRRSRLARWQTDHVAARLKAAHPDLAVEIVEVVTRGDEVRDRALSAIGERGLFTRELERVLLAGQADIAVHSLKDMETTLPTGLALVAVPERVDPSDALVSRHGGGLAALPAGALVGTSSIRRRAQLLALRPDLRFDDLRGNVPTRLEKLASGEGGLDAIVLARAGLERLGFLERVTAVISTEAIVPAVGQGALGIEGPAADARVRAVVAPLEHRETRIAVTAERAFLRRLHGGCQVPAGALARVERDELTLSGVVAALDGRSLFRDRVAGPASDPAGLGTALAETLLARGADRILAQVEAAFRTGASDTPETL